MSSQDESDQSGSEGTREALVSAAIGLLNDGACVASLGLRGEAIAKEAGYARNTYSYHFGTAGRQSIYDAIAKRLSDSVVEIADGNSEQYEMMGRAMEAMADRNTLLAAGRAMVHQAMVRDLGDFGEITRPFYLMLALAGLPEDVAGANYEEHLCKTHTLSQARYQPIYELFCTVTQREYVEDQARTQRAINAYLEGIQVHRVYGKGPDDAEVVDTILRIFWATTKPAGTSGLDIDEELFGRTGGGPN